MAHGLACKSGAFVTLSALGYVRIVMCFFYGLGNLKYFCKCWIGIYKGDNLSEELLSGNVAVVFNPLKL